MKIHLIKLENLNSLHGEHKVDIEKDLGDPALFLITGPTGSGKTTLMDAAGLALYGLTPRLQGQRGDEELDPRNVMSTGEAAARAVVEFTRREGSLRNRYRATWACRRARDRSDGNLQKAVRTLELLNAETGTWDPVTSGSQHAVATKFDEVLDGLSFPDFQRCMLLAQGEFAAFLKSSEDERASILERLTDTAMYREIGANAAQRKQASEQLAAVARAKLGEIRPLDDLAEAALRQRVEALAATCASLRAEVGVARLAHQWRVRVDELDAETSMAEAEVQRARGEFASHAADFARLAEHDRCVPGFASLSNLESQEKAVAALAADLPTLTSAVETYKAALAKAEAEVKRDAEASEAAAARWTALEPMIAKARGLRVQQSEAKRELTKAEQAQAAAVAVLKDAQRKHAEAVEQARSAQKLRDQATTVALKLAPSRSLVAGIAGLRELHRRLLSDEKALRDLEMGAKDAQRQITALHLAVAVRQPKIGGARTAVDHSSAIAKLAESDLFAALCGSASVAAHRKKLKAEATEVGARLRAVDDAQRVGAEVDGLAASLKSLAEADAIDGEQAAALAQQVAKAQQELEAETAGRAALLQELEDLRFMQTLARERGRLHEGVACPLCGSVDHPIVEDGKQAEVDRRTEKRCAALEAGVEDHSKAIADDTKAMATLEKKLASVQGGLATRGLERDRAAKTLATTTTHLARLLAEVSLATRDGLSDLKATLVAADHGLEAKLSALEEFEKRNRAAAEQLRSAKDALDELLRADVSDGREAGVRAQALEEAKRQVEGLQAKIGTTSGELRSALEQADVHEADFAQALTHAAKVVGELEGADQAIVSADTTLSALLPAIAAKKTTVESCTKELSDRGIEQAQRSAALESVATAITACLDGENPDEVERQAKAAVKRTADAFAAATGQCSAIQNSLTKAQERQHAETERHAKAVSVQREANRLLVEVLAALGIASRAELAAHALGEGERARIAAAKHSLEVRVSSTVKVYEDRAAALAGHRASRPDGLDERMLPEVLAKRLSECEKALEAGIGEHGDAARDVQKQEEARTLAGERQAELDHAMAGLQTWTQLHELIGKNEGKQFQRFAQVLNLESLIAKANLRLAVLCPRYSLAVARDAKNHPRLAFAVHDASNGNAERPVTNLSGGETFLVSLALALALADLRAVRMPIETLLLDEGFGTLDPETLQVAMNALSTLNSQGIQIGIISHVEGLKERIDAQVVVEALGSGRSRIRVVPPIGAASVA